ncbi:MAG: hypothetical protein QME79_12225 [Bacillota bacterium]|nr:hypothetical protein [Bacillota bacterium]
MDRCVAEHALLPWVANDPGYVAATKRKMRLELGEALVKKLLDANSPLVIKVTEGQETEFRPPNFAPLEPPRTVFRLEATIETLDEVRERTKTS